MAEQEQAGERDNRVTIRFPQKDFEFMQRLVAEGEYANVTDVVRDAVKHHRTEWEMRKAPTAPPREHALMMYGNEVKSQAAKDWGSAHTSFMLPVHRYGGEVFLLDGSFFFSGHDEETKQPCALTFSLESITDVFLGYDDTYRRNDDRNMGLITLPLRITFRESNVLRTIYLWIGFNRFLRTSSDKKWFETLSAVRGREGSDTAR